MILWYWYVGESVNSTTDAVRRTALLPSSVVSGITPTSLSVKAIVVILVCVMHTMGGEILPGTWYIMPDVWSQILHINAWYAGMPALLLFYVCWCCAVCQLSIGVDSTIGSHHTSIRSTIDRAGLSAVCGVLCCVESCWCCGKLYVTTSTCWSWKDR